MLWNLCQFCSDTVTPVNNSQKEDAVTEDRIANILSEAQHAMNAKKAAEQVRHHKFR